MPTFSEIVGPRGRAFGPAAGEVVGVSFNVAAVRQMRLVFTGNTGRPAAKLSGPRILAA
ncbi:hypothetical protein ACIBH1_04575 [Nonomuraea sp. NPDC050663]|uniref:hypothetical protein n=1 Tax=Nonomuraea sp. NPDC050663 TaxID=3364370 RepID=UPI00379317E4